MAALQTRFDVTFLSGGVFPAGLAIPPGVNFVQLPALMARRAGGPRAQAATGPGPRPWNCGAAVLAHFAHVAPAVVVVESFPSATGC
ncbi:MAG: hypothetical protein R3A10_02035 [Caldilineaceae bacterium]